MKSSLDQIKFRRLSVEPEAAAYLDRMLDEPTVYGIMTWIDKHIERRGGYDPKYLRRIIEALIVVKGGTP